MIDAQLRVRKEAVLGPIVRRVPRSIHPIAVTLLAVVLGIGAAAAAPDGRSLVAVVLWLTNRVLDGVDGTLARQRDRQSDLGAYLDILMDFVVYAAVPIGLAAHAASRSTWVAAAVLLAAFYINTISWSYLSALLERRQHGANARYTSVTMPGGLVEGAETVVLYAIMLAAPSWAPLVFWVMAAAVAITVVQRVVWAVRNL